MENNEFLKYFGPADVLADTVNGAPGLFLRLGKTMIESLEVAENNVGLLIPATWEPFSMADFQLIEKIGELGLPAIYNFTNEFGWYAPPAGLPFSFEKYWVCQVLRYGRRLNQIKGTQKALKALFAMLFIELVSIIEDDIDGAIPFDTGVVNGEEMTFDRADRFWDSRSCDRCIEITVLVRWLTGVPDFYPPPGLGGLPDNQIEAISQQVFRILEWGLPADCRFKEVIFIDTVIYDPENRAFTDEFNIGFY